MLNSEIMSEPKKLNTDVENQSIESGDSVIDNLVIMREFGNIVNLLRSEEFLETVPKGKLKRIKWVPLFNCLKQSMFNDMVQELTAMWVYENMSEKLDKLEKQKEKFSEINENQVLWRPQLGNVKAQLRATDVANLQKQKKLLESLAKGYDARVNKLKKIVSAKRGYLKALQMDIQKYQKKNEELIQYISDKIENHNIINLVLPEKNNIENISWTEKDLD